MPNNLAPTSWIGTRSRNRLDLQHFRRGVETAVDGTGELFIERDKNGDFRLFKGKHEFQNCSFSSRDILHIGVRHFGPFLLYIC